MMTDGSFTTNINPEEICSSLQKQLEKSISVFEQCQYLFSEAKCLCKSIVYRKKVYIITENRSFFWINGQYAYGLICTHEKKSIECLKKFYSKVKFYNYLGTMKFTIPDTILHAYVMMRLVADYDMKQYIPLVHQAADYIKQEARSANNLLRYRRSSRQFLVDSLGMTIGFCYLYGITYADQEIIDIADYQITFILQMIEKYHSVFPYHAYNIDTNSYSGNNMWGRGIGWFLLGLTEAAINNPIKFQKDYQFYIDQVFKYQNQEGYFYDDFLKKNHIDTSITSMAALSMALGLRHGLINGDIERYHCLLELCISALGKSCTDSGHVINCSGECEGAGRYSIEYGNYFAQGYTLALIHVMRDKR